LKAESDGAVSYTKIQLVGGRGDASGENKPEPTYEVPNDAPKVEIPEFEGGIPGIPEVRELPEYTEPIGTVPNDAPKYEKPEFEGGVIPNDPPGVEIPEWNGGTVPNEAPVHYKPEFQGGIPGIPEERELPPFEGGVIPNDAPILDLPELEIPEESTKPTPEKPSTPEKAPKTSVDKKAAQNLLKIFGDKENKFGITRISVGDCLLSKECEGLKLSEAKYENVINRESGTAEHPRQIERVPAGVKFDLIIRLKVFDDV